MNGWWFPAFLHWLYFIKLAARNLLKRCFFFLLFFTPSLSISNFHCLVRIYNFFSNFFAENILSMCIQQLWICLQYIFYIRTKWNGMFSRRYYTPFFLLDSTRTAIFSTSQRISSMILLLTISDLRVSLYCRPFFELFLV